MVAALLVADGGAATTRPDHPRPPTRADVETALAKSGAPADLQRWAADDQLLTAAATDRSASETVRGRALAALAYAQTARVHAFLENFVIARTPSSAAIDRALVRRAAVSLGWLGGPRVVEVVAPLLDSGDAEVRMDAAAALALDRSPEAEKPLRARLAAETDPAVRREIEAALRAIATR